MAFFFSFFQLKARALGSCAVDKSQRTPYPSQNSPLTRSILLHFADKLLRMPALNLLSVALAPWLGFASIFHQCVVLGPALQVNAVVWLCFYRCGLVRWKCDELNAIVTELVTWTVHFTCTGAGFQCNCSRCRSPCHCFSDPCCWYYLLCL